MGRYIKYAARRESCVGWLGEIPDHWKTTQLKFLARFNYGDALASEIREDAGDIPVFGSNGVVGQHDRANTKAPVIFVGRKGSFGKVVYSDRAGFCIDTAYFVDKSSTKGHLKWLYYMLGQIGLDALSQDTGVPGLSRELAHSKYVVVPPESEQNQIAAFLDHETAKIDRLIARQERLIELLKEKRQAVISHAVTKGLNPDAPMKDSGVEWLGEVPAHWEARLLSTLSNKITNGYVGPTRDIFVDDGVVYLQSMHIKNNQIVFHKPYYVSLEWSQQKAKSILKEGDVLIVQTGDIGQVAVVPKDYEGANCHALIIVSTKHQLTGRYLSWVLNSTYGYNSLKAIQTGALHPHLNCEYVRTIRVPLPPIREQDEICAYIDSQLNRFDLLMKKSAQQIALLREHRASLISAAVTGKIDVRGWQKPNTEPQEAATAVSA